MIGSDGAFTFLLANLLIVCTCGTSLVWHVIRVRRVARETPAAIEPPERVPDLVMVLGLRLAGDRVTPAYAARLRRAAKLVAGDGAAGGAAVGNGAGNGRTILVVGGRTGDATVSEAEQGRRFLIEEGVPPARILIEDRSAHTLENLRHARTLLEGRSRQPFALVTSRDHLARSRAMARGLRLPAAPCAAEDRWQDGLGPSLRLLCEGYLLHWYNVGSAWSRWTGNRRSLAKIT